MVNRVEFSYQFNALSFFPFGVAAHVCSPGTTTIGCHSRG